MGSQNGYFLAKMKVFGTFEQFKFIYLFSKEFILILLHESFLLVPNLALRTLEVMRSHFTAKNWSKIGPKSDRSVMRKLVFGNFEHFMVLLLP